VLVDLGPKCNSSYNYTVKRPGVVVTLLLLQTGAKTDFAHTSSAC